MAKSRISGISIEIDGNTTGLSKALEGVNKKIGSANTELKDLNKLLKIDPGNTELLAIKQGALANAISETTNKLNQLKSQQDSVNKAFAEGKIDEKQYRAFNTELEDTEISLKNLTNQLDENGNVIEYYGKSTEEATQKTSVFGDVLKANLTSEVIIGGVKKIADGMAQIGRGVASLVSDSIKSFAQYEQMVGGIETLFGDSANIVQKNAEQAYKTAGISANKYMEQATSFSATLLQGLGGDTKKASEYADLAIRDMSDNANKMGTSIDMIQNAYQRFRKK